jgi:N-acetylneuraminate lyase
MKFEGIMPALVTPLKADESINTEVLARLIKYFDEKGAHGFYVGGATGDGSYLRIDERKATTEVAARLCKEYNKVCIVHCGSKATRDAVELIEYAVSLGVDAVSAMPQPKTTAPQRKAYYTALTEAAGETPFLIYYIPALSVDVSLEELLDLLSLKNVIGLKFSDANFFYMKRLLIHRPDIVIFSGEDELFTYGLLAGAHGGIGMNYNVFPELFVTMYKCCKNGDIVNAMKLQDALSHFLDPVFEYGLWESVEHTVELRFGMGMRCFREPNTIHVMTDAQKAVVAERMQYLDNVVAEVVADINK